MFHNPVAVHTNGDAVETLARLLGGRPYVLVSSAGWQRRGLPQRIHAACGQALIVIDGIRENPTLEALAALEPALAPLRGSGPVVVALGGGSVMDTAKAIAAGLAARVDMAMVGGHARANTVLPAGLEVPPLFCIPTTAGTGSEVTKTATLWDATARLKHSLADDRLFPSVAILDPTLTQTAPPDLTLAAGLDALSHAMESIWNVHHNAVSDAFAAAAIQRIKQFLPAALSSDDLRPRAELQLAALLAGLAISSTRTALAHSISYPLTARLGLRHGLACSFTLPEVAAYNLEARPDRIEVIAEAFGVGAAEELPAALRAWMNRLGVYEAVRAVLRPEAIAGLADGLVTPARAENNIRPATAADAWAILTAAVDEGKWVRVESPPAVGRVVWITGLSAAGKSTLARDVAEGLRAEGRQVVLLDGDELRGSLDSGGGGYTPPERRELARRYAGLCRYLAGQGLDVVCATMSLFRDLQAWNRANLPAYVEVYVKANLETLMARDTRGLYRRAIAGEIANVVGIDLRFEEPAAPDLVIDNNAPRTDLRPLAAQVLSLLTARRCPSRR